MNGKWKEEFDKKLIQLEDAENATKGCHAIIILTEWDCFKSLNYEKFYEKM